MRVTVVGAGPAGLFFAIRLKMLKPDADIVVLEQRERAGGKGVGIVLPEEALNYLDRIGLQGLRSECLVTSDIELRRNNDNIVIPGNRFFAIARSTLLAELRKRCDSAGLTLRFASPIREWQDIPQSDLVVGADGVHSHLRSFNEQAFETKSFLSKTRYAWFCTPQRYDRVTVMFRSTALGSLEAHAYSHTHSHSTFIIGCDPQAYQTFRFNEIPQDESDALCSRIFSADLMSYPLERVSLGWWPLTTVTNANWYTLSPVPTVLIGDAAHAIHFSSGPGTALAFEDAETLAKLIGSGAALENALRSYQAAREPALQNLHEASSKSEAWFEDSPKWIEGDIFDFTYGFLKRTGNTVESDVQTMLARAKLAP